MLITLKFNPKSTAKNVNKAVKLAEKINSLKYTPEDKVVTVSQNTEAVHKDFIVILEIVIRLAKTEIFIDDELVEDVNYIYDLITCEKKSFCTGVCSLDTNIFSSLFCELGIIKDKSFFFPLSQYEVKKLNIATPEIFSLIASNYVEINRDKLIDAYIASCTNFYKACSVFNMDATVNELKKQPEIITIKFNRGYFDQEIDDQDEEPESTVDVSNQQAMESFVISLPNEQINQIAVKIADEMEIRLRKVLLELKKS